MLGKPRFGQPRCYGIDADVTLGVSGGGCSDHGFNAPFCGSNCFVVHKAQRCSDARGEDKPTATASKHGFARCGQREEGARQICVNHFVERFDLHSMRRADEKRSDEVCDPRNCPITVINAQISVPEHNWKEFVEDLNKYDVLENTPFKVAVEDNGKSFFKLTIKVRDKIVADGLSIDDYDVTNVGTHLNAQEWNNAIDGGATVFE